MRPQSIPHQMAIAVIGAVSLVTSGANAFCTNFTVSPQLLCQGESITGGLICDYFPTSHQNTLSYVYQGSPAVFCTPGNPQYPRGCLASEQAGLEITQPGLTNITLIDDEERTELFDLISQALSSTFPVSANVITTSAYTGDIGDGKVGFLSLSPSVYCVEGVLDGCANSSLVDLTAVRACAPHTGSDGTLSLGAVSQSDITNDTASVMGTGPVPTPVVPIELVPVASNPAFLYTAYTTASATINLTSVPAYSHPPFSSPTTLAGH